MGDAVGGVWEVVGVWGGCGCAGEVLGVLGRLWVCGEGCGCVGEVVCM